MKVTRAEWLAALGAEIALLDDRAVKLAADASALSCIGVDNDLPIINMIPIYDALAAIRGELRRVTALLPPQPGA